MFSLVKTFVSSGVNKHAFLFTLLALFFGINLYLVQIHGFTVFEFSKKYGELDHLEYFIWVLAYSFLLVFGVHFYMLLDGLISSVNRDDYEFNDWHRPMIPIGNLKRVAIYQSNSSALKIYDEHKKKTEDMNNRLFMSFLFIVAVLADGIMSMSQSVVCLIYKSQYSWVLYLLGFLGLNACLAIWHVRREDGFFSKRVPLFDINEEVGRVVLKNFYDSYEHHQEMEKKRYEESLWGKQKSSGAD